MSNNRKKVGLFTLGITLILVGIAIILTRYTQYEFLKDLFLLWPAFLIVLGLEFIISKLYYDNKHQEVQLSPSGISIFLAIVILFTSFIWTNADFNFNNLNLNFNNNWLQNYKDVVEESYKPDKFELSGTQLVVIDNVRGSVDVQPSEDNKLRLEAQIRIATNNKEEAMGLINNIININVGPTTTIASSNPNQDIDHSLQYVNITLWVPKELKVNVKTGFGDVLVANMENDVTVKQEHSDVDINNIKGNVDISSQFGSIRVNQIAGDLAIINAHGAVDVQNVTGSADIENSYNSTQVVDVVHNVSIKSKHGQVDVENIQGDAQVENEYNNTNCSVIKGDLKVSAQHSAVNLEKISGDIEVSTSYSPISLTNESYLNADIKANTSYSAIRGDKGINLRVDDDENFQEASVVHGDGSQKIRLKNQHGDIRIE